MAGRRRPSFRDARARILAGLGRRGWVWWLSMLWVVMGAGGTLYAFVCTMVGCTTNQCTNAEFWLPMYNGESRMIGAVANLAQTAWPVLAALLLVAGFVRLRGWRRRNWLRAAAWASAWIAAFALMGLIVVAGWAWANSPTGASDTAWGELPVFALWLALGAWVNRILSTPGVNVDSSSAALRRS
jgi:glucan phosphoethanolaminetransferase (alkaline phosphatase superfamily)